MSRTTSLYESLLQDLGPSERIRASAAIIPWRHSEKGEIEVFWVRRAATLPFMGGWWAFPGGGLSRRDLNVEIRGEARGLGEGITSPSPGLDDKALQALGSDHAPGLLACALRELFEETGLWLGGAEADTHSAAELAPHRRRLLAKDTTLEELMAELGPLDAGQLVFAGRWLTPPFVPTRFDNRFFLLHWPMDRAVQPEHDDGELDRGEWIRPEVALGRWRAGEVMAAPPILHTLRVLGERGAEGGLARLLDTREADLGPMRRIEFLPGLILLPMRTPTLPPATHTNVFLLAGQGENGHQAVLIDPAPHAEHEKKHLLEALDAAQSQGIQIEAIWLSHHHPDHLGAALEVKRHLGVPLLGHRESAPQLSAWGLALDGELEDGQRVALGDLTVEIHHTPGHTRGHLSFEIIKHQALIAADLVSTLSTIVIDPPDGQMGAYLSSLERMAARDFKVLLPSHGPVHLKPSALLRKTMAHRLEREGKVKDAYRRGSTTPESMVAEVYAEVPEMMHPVACRQIQAHLEHLHELGELDGD